MNAALPVQDRMKKLADELEAHNVPELDSEFIALLREACTAISDSVSRADRLQGERDREAQGCMVNDPRLDYPECDEMDRLQGFGDVNDWKTLARKMERRARFYENENQMRAESLDRFNRIIGYNNDDGHHSEPGPEEMPREIIEKGEAREVILKHAQLSLAAERAQYDTDRQYAILLHKALRAAQAQLEIIHDRHVDEQDCDEDADGHRTPNRDMNTVVDCNLAIGEIDRALAKNPNPSGDAGGAAADAQKQDPPRALASCAGPVGLGPDAVELTGREHVPGFWVVFDEKNDEMLCPEGFYINEKRAANFHNEPGFYKNHLVRLYRDDALTVQNQEKP